MTLTLTPELEQFVREATQRGAYASSSEYVRALIRERYARDLERASHLKALEEALARGLADAEAGRTSSLERAISTIKVTINDDECAATR
jgi:antitoxin ParD1/3/4